MFLTISNVSYLYKKFSLTFTMFEVLDGTSFSQRFKKTPLKNIFQNFSNDMFAMQTVDEAYI